MLTREQHDRACENRARALIKLYDKGHYDAFHSGLQKWLDDVERDGGGLAHHPPGSLCRQDAETILAEITAETTKQELWNVMMAHHTGAVVEAMEAAATEALSE